MLSEQPPIDDLFRKKEEASIPATHREDAHWQQMKTLLAAGVTPSPKRRRIINRRILLYAGGIMVITVVVIITLLNTTRNRITTTAIAVKNTAYKNPARQAVQQPAKAVTDTTTHPVSSTRRAMPVKRNTSIRRVPTKTTNGGSPSQGGSPLKNTRKVPTKTSRPAQPSDASNPTIPSGPSDAVVAEAVAESPNAAELLKQFYYKLEQQPQEFLINTYTDTILVGKEGTRLHIPSHAFMGATGKTITGPVKIVLEEFYSYDKMIAAGLGTTSNGEQLVSGGMLHIKAEVDGHELLLKQSMNITVKMPTKNYDGRMQLFTANASAGTGVNTVSVHHTVIDAAQVSFHTEVDTVASSDFGSPGNKGINWVADDQWQHGYSAPEIRVINLQNTPSRVSYGNKTTATFYISNQSALTKDELKKEMQKRYGYYYDKIKVKHLNMLRRLGDWTPVGDSLDLPFKDALKYKLVSVSDSIQYMQKYIADSTRYFASLGSERKEYIFAVKNLGWINCDRFSRNPEPKVQFTLNLGEGTDAHNYHAQLVFTRYQSVMTGYYGANKFLFSQIPENEPVQLICVGVKNGKVVTCVQPLTASAREVNNLVFEETTPEQFKQKLQTLNLQ